MSIDLELAPGMTTELHLPARPGAVVFAFRADPGTRDRVDDLALREHACCPFLDYRVETVGEQVIWTLAGDDEVVDAFHALPDRR